MKTLLIGLLLVGSFSAFAQQNRPLTNDDCQKFADEQKALVEANSKRLSLDKLKELQDLNNQIESVCLKAVKQNASFQEFFEVVHEYRGF